MKGSYCEWNVYRDETYVEKRIILWFLYICKWKHIEIFEKKCIFDDQYQWSEFWNVQLVCENCTKTIKRKPFT